MKVIYKKSLTEKVIEAIYEAEKQNKEIERIEITRDELVQLRDEWRKGLVCAVPKGTAPPAPDANGKIGTLFGVEIYHFATLGSN